MPSCPNCWWLAGKYWCSVASTTLHFLPSSLWAFYYVCVSLPNFTPFFQPWNWKMLAPRKKSYDQPRQHIKKQRHYFADKVPSSQNYGFSSSHVWMWEVDCKQKAERQRTDVFDVLEKTLESTLDSKEIKPANPKRNQSWIFIGKTDAKLKFEYFGHLMRRTDSLEKDPDARKDWRQEEKGMTEDEIVGWHYRLNGHESEQAPGVGDGQGSLVCCSPWGHKESDTPEW